MFSRYTREMIEATENSPALYIQRQRELRRRAIREAVGMVCVIGMALLAVAFWLAYEGWITPDMFK